jgi:hypothetical protein
MKLGQREREDGGYEEFSVSCVCGVYVCCIPYVDVILFQYLLSSTYWDCFVSDGRVAACSYFGQVVCPLISF